MFLEYEDRVNNVDDAVVALDIGRDDARVVDLKSATGVNEQIAFQHCPQRIYPG